MTFVNLSSDSAAKVPEFKSEPYPVISPMAMERFLAQFLQKNGGKGTSLVVQLLRLHASTAGDVGSIPGQGTKIPHAMEHGQKIKNK